MLLRSIDIQIASVKMKLDASQMHRDTVGKKGELKFANFPIRVFNLL